MSSVESPEIDYHARGQVDSCVFQPDGGGAIISQGVYSTAHNYYGIIGGGASFSSHITATNSKGTEVVMSGLSTAEICYSQDYAMMRSEAFGMGIAKPGEGEEYYFSVNGSQKTVSTTLPAPTPVFIPTSEFMDKELNVTFRQNSMDMDQPADILDQEINFNYGTFYNMPTYYSYDYSSFLSIGDSSCSSSMSLSHLN